MLCKVVALGRDSPAYPAISATSRKALQRPSARLKRYIWSTPRPVCLSTCGSFQRRYSSFQGRLRVGLIQREVHHTEEREAAASHSRCASLIIASRHRTGEEYNFPDLRELQSLKMTNDIGTTPIIADLQGRRVLVTGGSAGIGKATALAFDKNGCKVAILGRRKERLDAVTSQMKHGLSVVADLTKGDAEMQRAVRDTIDAFGGLDIIVNSGGVITEEMSGTGEEAFISAIKLHVTANLAIIRAAEEELIKNKGAVINVSSVGALVPMSPNMASYGVAKAAQDQLTKNLAFEFATKGVRVNSVLPAAIQTEVFEQMAEKQGKPLSELMDHMAGMHAMKRVGQPEEIAAPIVFLASNAASFITGQNLAIDGGCLMGYWLNSQPFNSE